MCLQTAPWKENYIKWYLCYTKLRNFLLKLSPLPIHNCATLRKQSKPLWSQSPSRSLTILLTLTKPFVHRNHFSFHHEKPAISAISGGRVSSTRRFFSQFKVVEEFLEDHRPRTPARISHGLWSRERISWKREPPPPPRLYNRVSLNEPWFFPPFRLLNELLSPLSKHSLRAFFKQLA